MRIDKVYNANVYIGTNSLLGRAAEVTLPEVAMATDEHMALGMIGKVLLPTGLEAMGMAIKWNGFYGDRILLGADPFKTHRLQLRASIESYEAGGRVAERGLVVHTTVRWNKMPLGTFAPGASSDVDDELSVTYLKLSIAGTELVEIDVLANIWRVNGVDILARYRANIGGA